VKEILGDGLARRSRHHASVVMEKDQNEEEYKWPADKSRRLIARPCTECNERKVSKRGRDTFSLFSPWLISETEIEEHTWRMRGETCLPFSDRWDDSNRSHLASTEFGLGQEKVKEME